MLFAVLSPLGWRSNRKSARPRRSFIPRLTVLEDRTLLSTFTVMSLADSGAGTLRAGVASGADTIRFDSHLHGTIKLANEIAIDHNVKIDGPGANQITVSGEGTTRIFDITGNDVTISDLTLANGLANSTAVNGSNGGAIYHGSGSLHLSHDVFNNNTADGTASGDFGYGGGILNAAGTTLDISKSSFTGNVAEGSGKGRGGALFNYGTATIDRTDFTANQALGGSNGNPLSSSAAGGAIANLGDNAGATVTIRDSTFTRNEAVGSKGQAGGTAGAGGAIWNRYANAPDTNTNVITDSVVVSGSTFVGNRAVGGDAGTGLGGDGLGGAILVQSNGASPAFGDNATVSTLQASNNTFIGNEAEGGAGGGRGLGGAILSDGDLASSTITGSLFLANEAEGQAGGQGTGLAASDGLALGGGICSGFGGSLNVSSSIFIGNQAHGGSGSDGWGGGIANFASAFDSASSIATISHSTFVNNQALGGSGGDGLGGALFNGGTGYFGTPSSPFVLAMTVTDSSLVHNQAIGGNGSTGGNGGNGEGGGLYNGLLGSEVPTVILSNTVITANEALGGMAGSGGSAGQGIGGGISTATPVFVHKIVVKGNKASTHDDDVSGTLIPF